MNGTWNDVRLALRGLRRSPGFAALAVLILGLGIGANTAIYSVVRAVLLAPLPFPEPQRLVTLCEVHPSVEGFCVISPPNGLDLADAAATVEELGLVRGWPFMLQEDGRRRSIDGGIATPGLFRALGLPALRGRLPVDEDQRPGAAPVVLVSHDFWASELGGDPQTVGRSLLLDGESVPIIGVLPPTFRVPGLEHVRLWRPLHIDPRDETHRTWRGFRGIARLSPAATPAQALAELSAAQTRLAETHPDVHAGWSLRLLSLHESLVGGVRPTLTVFTLAVGLVLLVACANLAHLMLARATRRQQEFAVRAALGAGRLRLVRQALTESVVLAAAGAGVGLLMASWGLDGFVSLAPPGVPRLENAGLDGHGLLFAAGLSVAAGLLAGVAPALRGTGAGLALALKGGERRAATPGGMRLRRLLVAGEVALTLALVIGAALLARTFLSMSSWRPGLHQTDVTTAWTFASDGTYRNQEQVRALYDRVLAEVQTVPGVVSVGLASAGPLFGGIETDLFRPEGTGKESGITARWYDVSPGYFPTHGRRVLRGRGLSPEDRAGAPRVAVVNETLARRWPGGDPIGERITWADQGLSFEIVGIVADVPPLRVSDGRRAEIFWPFAQLTRWASFLVVRTEGDPEPVTAALRRRVDDLGADLDLGTFVSMDERLARRLIAPRFNMLLVGIFAAVALVLAAAGTYGVIAYAVAARTREIGVRMALGADRGAILHDVLRRGMTPVLAGAAAGLILALLLSRSMESLLSGVAARDGATFVLTTAGLLAVALAACWGPAHRAARLDPQAALRHE